MEMERNGVIDRLLTDHERVVAVVRRLEPFLTRDLPPVEPEFAQLRWALLREFTRHHAFEKSVLLRAPRAPAVHSAPGRELLAAFNDHMVQWTATAIHEHWPRYRSAARALLARVCRQMQHEETVLFPLLR